MRLNLPRLLGAGRATAAQRRPAAPKFSCFRPSLETLEERTVMSAPMAMAPALGAALVAPQAAPQAAAPVVPISITGVSAQNGGLVANGLLGNIPFTAPLTLTPAVSSTATILNLHLGPIHLNLLGLHVDTSEICLAVTATQGSGNLLGNLLFNVAHLLDQGTSLGTVLSGLGSQLGSLESGLTGLLNGGLGALTAPTSVGAAPAQPPRTTNILHLSLGPVNLNLLGLGVTLDNCANPAGPVTLDISAQRGPGNLLGNLLSSVAHLLDRGLGVPAADAILTRVADEIFTLL
jgi:hypothetical protein